MFMILLCLNFTIICTEPKHDMLEGEELNIMVMNVQFIPTTCPFILAQPWPLSN